MPIPIRKEHQRLKHAANLNQNEAKTSSSNDKIPEFNCDKHSTVKDSNEHQRMKHRKMIQNEANLSSLPNNEETIAKFHCNKCESSYITQQKLAFHLKTRHNISSRINILNLLATSRRFKCFHCDMRFKFQSHRASHIKYPTAYGHKCKVYECAKKFTSCKVLKQHQRRSHAVSSSSKAPKKVNECQRFNCDKCESSFGDRGNLTTHLRKKHNIRPEPLHWLNIPDFFSPERSYKCHECDMRFAFGPVRRRHMKNHSSFEFKCEINGCGMKYWHELILKEHQKRAHEVKTPEISEVDDVILKEHPRFAPLDLNQNYQENLHDIQMMDIDHPSNHKSDESSIKLSIDKNNANPDDKLRKFRNALRVHNPLNAAHKRKSSSMERKDLRNDKKDLKDRQEAAHKVTSDDRSEYETAAKKIKENVSPQKSLTSNDKSDDGANDNMNDSEAACLIESTEKVQNSNADDTENMEMTPSTSREVVNEKNFTSENERKNVTNDDQTAEKRGDEPTGDVWGCIVCQATYSSNDQLFKHMWDNNQ